VSSSAFRLRCNTLDLLGCLVILASCISTSLAASTLPIDRKSLVERFSPSWTRIDPTSAFMVGNGNFAFTADITGLQTFQDQYSPLVPLMTQAQWAWHSFPNPNKYTLADSLTPIDVRGTKQLFPYFSDWERAKEPAIKWLRENPHRISLGRVRLHMVDINGKEAAFTDLSNTQQKLDMWNGVLISDFTFANEPVHIETRVHPKLDMVVVTVKSALLVDGRLSIELMFPGVSTQINPDPADWTHPEQHQTIINNQSSRGMSIERHLDDTHYFVQVVTDRDSRIDRINQHHFGVVARGNDSLTLMMNYSEKPSQRMPNAHTAIDDISTYWHRYWSTGGFVDLTASSDPRAIELQRRILLSQYLMAVNSAGVLPPQEEGLFSNSWNGKFHLEMHLWHAAHFAAWGHTDLLERSMPWYFQQLPEARQRAQAHGLSGAWWPKMVGPEGRESPSAVNPLIMWQQPHPIYLSELIYRAKPTQSTLKQYEQLVFETAELLASYLYFDKSSDRYVLGPPVMPAQEVYPPLTTINPTFELEYFRFGLMTAQQWRERLGKPRNAQWDLVLNKLAALPQSNGLYLPTESNPDFWEQTQSATCSKAAVDPGCLNRDHPSMLAALGLLPGTNVDQSVMRNTLHAVEQHWDLRQTWGWDFPMMAMTAARLHEPNKAIDYLFSQQTNNQFGVTGMTPREHLIEGNFIRDAQTYFPSNGSLLLAVGMMAAGWDGEKNLHPGFPTNGTWVVRSEGVRPLP
jgi:hypothetical protein